MASGRNLARNQEMWMLLLTSNDRSVIAYVLTKATQDPFMLTKSSRQVAMSILVALGRAPDIEDHKVCDLGNIHGDPLKDC